MQVVAAELNNSGSREIVMFIIRVADDSGEWSVARRFRNFETLHRAMRGCGMRPLPSNSSHSGRAYLALQHPTQPTASASALLRFVLGSEHP